MLRAVLAVVAATLIHIDGASAQAGPGLGGMDVLDLDDTPEHAVRRVEEAMARSAAERGRWGDAPAVAPFIPEDSLATRGLASEPSPPTIAPDAGFQDFGDRFEGHEGRGRKHD